MASEYFRTYSRYLCREATGFAFVYDCSDRHSLEDIPLCIEDIRKYSLSDVPILLAGIAFDTNREVTLEEGSLLAQTMQFGFIELIEPVTINEVFEALCTQTQGVAMERARRFLGDRRDKNGAQ